MSQQPPWLEKWKQAARALTMQTHALALAYRDPRTPWYARAFAGLVVAYAFSPIDLVPDFIPVLGYLDDLVLVPLGVTLALKMIPAPVMSEAQAAARQAAEEGQPMGRAAAVVIVAIWLALAALGVLLLVRALTP